MHKFFETKENQLIHPPNDIRILQFILDRNVLKLYHNVLIRRNVFDILYVFGFWDHGLYRNPSLNSFICRSSCSFTTCNQNGNTNFVTEEEFIRKFKSRRFTSLNCYRMLIFNYQMLCILHATIQNAFSFHFVIWVCGDNSKFISCFMFTVWWDYLKNLELTQSQIMRQLCSVHIVEMSNQHA